MTLQQLFRALIHALTTNPESHQVDIQLADLAASAALALHATKADSLKLACLTVTNPEPLIAADQLLRPYGLVLTATPHQRTARLISIKRHQPEPDQSAGVIRVHRSKGAKAA
ncbi:MAG: hypothetical protein WDA03_11370 [Trueperaceae bacterium]